MPTDEEPQSPGQPQYPGRTRSSSEERERTVATLRAAAEAGYLSLDEADERMAVCYQSQYRDQLAPLLADLPHQGRGLVPPDPAEEAAAQAARRDIWRGLPRHVGGVGVFALVLIGIWALTGGGVFWPAWPLFFLALTVVFRAKHRARRRMWRHYAAHNGFDPADHWERHYWRRYGREDYAARS
jgi:hypothetical protein